MQKWGNCGGSETPGKSSVLSTNNPQPNPHLRTRSNLHIPHEAQIWIAAAVILIERIGKDGYINIVFSGHVDIATVKIWVLSICKHNKQVFRTICIVFNTDITQRRVYTNRYGTSGWPGMCSRTSVHGGGAFLRALSRCILLFPAYCFICATWHV